jgi:hypothetical protein
MRMRGPVIIATIVLGLASAPARAADADAPPRGSRITSFTISPAPSLAPHPRPRVDTRPLDAPAVPSVVVAAGSLAPERMIGRWTERDPAYCRDDQYVVEWSADRLRVVLDGRTIDASGVRYAVDGATLKVERLGAGGEVASYWRLAAVDDDHVEWVESAERRGDALAVIAKPDKLFVRCAPEDAPAPGLLARAQRWLAAARERLWPTPAVATPADAPAPPAPDGRPPA